MNPTIISSIIGASTFLFTVFFAVYLNQRHVDKLMEQMDRRLQEMDRRQDARFEGLRAEMNARFGEMNVRFSAIDERLGRVERQIDTLFAKLQPVPSSRGD